MRSILLLVTVALFGQVVHADDDAGIPASIVRQDGVNTRYPPRLADWLWTNPDYVGFIDASLRETVENEIRLFEALRDVEGSAGDLFDEKEAHIAGILSKRFAVRDFTRGKEVLLNEDHGTSLCVSIDPKFGAASVKTIQRAAQLFVEVATDEAVIQAALDSSVDDPTPQPERYLLQNGEPLLDRNGNKLFDDEYQFMRECLVRPPNALFLQRQLKEVMRGKEHIPGLLLVSHSVGDAWWGGGYIGFAYNEAFRLKREAPSQPYFYIRLNEDKMTEGVEHHDDPAFWASKIAHEVLHNLNYWHPSYESPTHRDENNMGKKMAFIVAYERAVMEAAGKRLKE